MLDPIADITVNAGDTVTLNPAATDSDGDTLTFTCSGWMSSKSYATSYDDAGVHTVTVTVSDGSLTDTQDVTITVNEGTVQVQFEWELNTKNDLAGYKIYYGNSTGSYDSSVDVGNQTRYTISGLVSDETYYFASTAYDYSGNESPYSEELISGNPAITVGIISPTPGSTLNTSTVPFQWSPGTGVTAYWLGVGTSTTSVSTTPYGDIYGSTTGTKTTQQVTGIPINGYPVYVRLWWKISNGAWTYTDYTYQTQGSANQVY